ncbi:hypothetical protein [Olivibacter domesticus]|uniref:Uncharacterized protein n=1 Tax=Olivibacter domesticus TaxID=407022 RepID=A0A1H7IXL5_OLID1|nr:hypothetical protein [Olivibacter domesticus]SEK67138.1 hypothetical protein SAMN05661044_00861 [Olivibacter domesticus]
MMNDFLTELLRPSDVRIGGDRPYDLQLMTSVFIVPFEPWIASVSAASFKAKYNNVWQLVLTKKGNNITYVSER